MMSVQDAIQIGETYKTMDVYDIAQSIIHIEYEAAKQAIQEITIA